VSPLQVKAGDPITLKMDVKGSGNFKNLKMPVFHDPDFKSYEPNIKDAGDAKTAEEVIIPVSSQVREVPALHFTYFDTASKDYKTVTQGPFPIQVTAPSADQDFKAVGFADVSKESALLAANQFSWGKLFNQAGQLISKLCASLWFWLGFGFVLASGIAFYLWRRFQNRLENDPAFARRLKAVREAKQALMPAEEFIKSGRPKDFYALISKVLRDYLANKWHQNAAALTIEAIIKHLRTIQSDESSIEQVKSILEQSDLVCFAGGSADANRMRSDLSQAEGLITRFEKHLK